MLMNDTGQRDGKRTKMFEELSQGRGCPKKNGLNDQRVSCWAEAQPHDWRVCWRFGNGGHGWALSGSVKGKSRLGEGWNVNGSWGRVDSWVQALLLRVWVWEKRKSMAVVVSKVQGAKGELVCGARIILIWDGLVMYGLKYNSLAINQQTRRSWKYRQEQRKLRSKILVSRETVRAGEESGGWAILLLTLQVSTLPAAHQTIPRLPTVAKATSAEHLRPLLVLSANLW